MAVINSADFSHKQYDAVIVGAGIAGSILAKELSANKFDVLLIEAGSGEPLNYTDYLKYVDSYQSSVIKSPNSPYRPSFSGNLPQADELDVISNEPNENSEGYLIQKGELPFKSDYTKILGGSSLHWLGTCLRMLPNDFKMRTLYGVGLDWPIEYSELKPYYKMAERELGVSADIEDQLELERILDLDEEWFEKDHVFPMHRIPLSNVDKFFSEALNNVNIKYGKDIYPLHVTSAPQARNSILDFCQDSRHRFFYAA
jgi:choline dehydrogenase-like flavoprotein